MPGSAEKTLRAWRLISAAAVAAALMLTIRRWVFDTVEIHAVYYVALPAKNASFVWPFLLTAISLVLALISVKQVERFSAAAAPGWLLWPLLALPYDFFNLAAALAVIAWCLSRCLVPKYPYAPLPRRTAWLFVALLTAAAAGWSAFLQNGAFRRIFLAYQDWGEYAECYLKLADGQTPWRAWAVEAGHFDPLPNLLMSTLFRFRRAPETVFFVTAVVLGSLPALLYKLALEYRLPRSSAVLLSFAAAVSPVLVNQSLAFFYGYHPVLFQGPLIIGFFIFERRKNRPGMAAMIALSLLVQETAAVLWFGYALYLVSCKRFRFGAALAVLSVLYFMFVSKVVMPFATGASGNPQLFHYAQLGDSLVAVVLSPFTRPRAFWGTVFQKQNLFFAAALLLPCGALALRSPRRLLIVLPLFMGVAMQASSDVKNPAMQYGFEITVVLLCATAAAAGGMLGNRTAEAKSTMRSGLRTVAVMSLLCAFFWSRLPVGKYSAEKIFRLPDATKTIGLLRGYSDQAGRVLTTKRLRLYHMFDRKVAPLDSEWKIGDTVVIDLGDANMEPVDHIRRRLLEDPRAVPCFPRELKPSRFVVWKIGEKPRPPWPFLCRTQEADFRRVGQELQQDDPAFEVRAVPDNGGATVIIRLREKIDCDVVIRITVIRGEKESHHTVCFGNIYPMWYATPGDTFIIPIPGGMPTALPLTIERCK